jgi:DNA-binding CsgD family transcriptional regulator
MAKKILLVQLFTKGLLAFVFLAISVVNPPRSVAQVKSVGLPLLHHFDKRKYKAGMQNWAIACDQYGVMYFANNEGLLRYDGSDFDLFPMPDPAKVVRSVMVSGDTIFTGSFEEFGYFLPDGKGGLMYHSLMGQLPSTERNTDEFWKIYKTPWGILYQSFTHLVFYKNGAIRLVKPPEKVHFAFFVQNLLYMQGKGGVVYVYDGRGFREWSPGQGLRNAQIWGMAPWLNHSLLIATIRDGVWIYKNNTLTPWNEKTNRLLKEYQIFSMQVLDGNDLAFGTIQNGLVITDAQGTILQHIDKSRGLQNNTVLSIATDCRKNLWLGLDNGIDYVEINSPVSIFNEGSGLQGACYAVAVHKGLLYVGTNQGLYFCPFNPRKGLAYSGYSFTKVPGTDGQVWTLRVLNNKLLCGHNFGTFLIDGGKIEKVISNREGSWIFIVPRNNLDIVIAGKYDGLEIYRREGNSWSFWKSVAGFQESARFIEEDEFGNLWIAHGLKGVYRIALNRTRDTALSVKLYDETSGLTTKNVSLARVRGQILFVAPDHIFKYNALTDRMEQYVELQEKLGNLSQAILLKEDKYLNLWLLGRKSVDFFSSLTYNTFKRLSTALSAFAPYQIHAFENLYIYDSSNVFMGTEIGLLHYDPNFVPAPARGFSAFFRFVKTLGDKRDTLLLRGVTPSGKFGFRIPYKANNIVAMLTHTAYPGKGMEYSFRLLGSDTTWSEWQVSPFAEFTDLKPGSYVLQGRARNAQRQISDRAAELKFEILPPWYTSVYAFVAYVLLLIIFLIIIRQIIRYKVRKTEKRLEQQKQAELTRQQEIFEHERLLAEKEAMRLRNEILQAELEAKNAALDAKNRELAQIAMQIAHKNEFVTRLRKSFAQLVEFLTPENKIRAQEILKTIDQEMKFDDEWDRFRLHFDEVHGNLLRRLKESFPALTPYDLKLCAYIRLNLSSKDIARILNVTPRAIEISRWRLRKKLGIDSETNLVEFFMNF